jgi:hypothetical protein
MHIGYVSDEWYQAVPGARVELRAGGARVATVESGPAGAVEADVSPGEYEVTVSKEGFGTKRRTVEVTAGGSRQFRLLSNDPLGYVWPEWVRAGEEGTCYLHTPEEAKLSLWRYGAEREHVRQVTWYDNHGPRTGLQRTPDGDYTETGVEWDDYAGSTDAFEVTVEAPEESGLYLFHMETKSGAFFAFPWVVAPAEPTARVAVLASTNTWNAYNPFGGRGNYACPEGLPDRPFVEPRHEMDRYTEGSAWEKENHEYRPISFERPCRFTSIPREESPTDPIEGKEESHTASAEWRLLAWLEREGYGYDLYADRQLHDGTLDLDAYDGFVVHTHPEYWSRQMYRRTKEWVFDRGGSLLYLGGNGLNAEVEYLDESRMRVNNNESAVPVVADPTTIPDDAYESRFHYGVESEGNLLGVVYTPVGITTAAPYEVRDADHWAFSGTGLSEGDQFGAETLQMRCAGGASGHETDKVSAFAPPGTRLLAKGLNPDDGGAEIVYYETDSGGSTFSVGSITWTAALLVDDAVATITRNALDRAVED